MAGNMEIHNDTPDVPGTTIVPGAKIEEIQNQSNEKLTESSSLSPNTNQTYFAEEKIRIPDFDSVSLAIER